MGQIKYTDLYIPHNLVLVYPNADLEESGGLSILDDFDFHQYQSIRGTVLMAPHKLLYFGQEIRKLKAQLATTKAVGSFEQRQIGELTGLSVEFDTDMDVRVGDTVVFKHTHHSQGDFRNVGLERKAILIPYHDLVMAIRPPKMIHVMGFPNPALEKMIAQNLSKPTRIMLNGYIFVEPMEIDESERTIGGLFDLQKEVIKKGYGRVLEVGKPNRGYLHYPNEADLYNAQVGDVVVYRKDSGVRMEWEFNRELGHDTKHHAIRIQRKDVLQILPS